MGWFRRLEAFSKTGRVRGFWVKRQKIERSFTVLHEHGQDILINEALHIPPLLMHLESQFISRKMSSKHLCFLFTSHFLKYDLCSVQAFYVVAITGP